MSLTRTMVNRRRRRSHQQPRFWLACVLATAATLAVQLVSAVPAHAVAVKTDTNYAIDGNPKLKNPERGMYFGGLPGPDGFHTIVPEWLWLGTVCGTNLAWKGYNQPGTSPVLNSYAQKLQNYRANGIKVLFRPRYDTTDGDPSPCSVNGTRVFQADSKARQFNHIDSVAAMLGDYRDVVAYIQAGYLGRWGEWNTEDDEPADAPLLYDRVDRKDIIGRILLKYANSNVLQQVELRRPWFANEVTLSNPNANVGLHNDCFMTSDSDSGTYSNFPTSPAPPSPNFPDPNFSNATAAKDWARPFTSTHSFGGETCPLTSDPNSPKYHTERWRSCATMRSEPQELHMNYLNGDYASDAVATWTAGGCYDEIRSKLGYRFNVTQVQYTPTVNPGQTFTVSIRVQNSGWGSLIKPRQAKLVLRSGAKNYVYDLAAGATKNWAPGITTQISVTGTPPPAGTYGVRLKISDPDALTRIPYAIKLASLRAGANTFDPSTGENKLGVFVTVS